MRKLSSALARELLERVGPALPGRLVSELLASDQSTEFGISAQRARVAELKRLLAAVPGAEAERLALLADSLVRKSVWIVGGDGWAYDIGYGGLDHVLALGRKVNVLVMDTEVYSNTGGQASKATPIGASAKFAVAGKTKPKKDLGMLAMSYGNVYVARVAFGAKDAQTLKAFQEADAFPGTSLIIAYSHCIAHGYDLAFGLEQQKLAVETGYWPLYRYDPRRAVNGESAFKLDSSQPKGDLAAYMRNETRFRMTENQDPKRYRELVQAAKEGIQERFRLYEKLEKSTPPPSVAAGGGT